MEIIGNILKKYKLKARIIAIFVLFIELSGCIELNEKSNTESAYYSYYISKSEKTQGETIYLYIYVHMKIKNEDLQCGVSANVEDWRLHVKNKEYLSYHITSNNETIQPGEDYNFTITYRLRPRTDITYAYLTYHGQNPDSIYFVPYHKMN